MIFEKIKHFIFPETYTQGNQPKTAKLENKQKKEKLSFVQILDESATEFPDIDESQFEELTKFVHANNEPKQEAANQQQREDSQIFEEVKQSVCDHLRTKIATKQSKAQLKMEELKKIQGDQFSIRFGHYFKIFSLFDLVFKSYL